MASPARKFDISDWKSLGIFALCVLAGNVISGVIEILGSINFPPEYQQIMAFAIALVCKFLQRFLTDFAEKYGVQYKAKETIQTPQGTTEKSTELSLPRDEQ